MGNRQRALGLGLGLLALAGLGFVVLQARVERDSRTPRRTDAATALASAEARLESAAPPPELARRALALPEEPAPPEAAATDGASLLGRVLLPAAARGRQRDVRVWWTYERGVLREGDLATLPPVTPDADGRFRIDGLPLDVPLVLWAHAPFAPEAGRALAPFTAGERRELELTLDSWVRLEGVVLGADSLPLADVLVRATLQEAGEAPVRGGPRGADLTRKSAADGRFEFLRLTTGQWLLDFDRPLLGGEPLVDLRAGDVRGLVFIVDRPNCLRLIVRWPDGTIEDEASPRSMQLGNGVRVASGSDGWSYCDLPPGEHEFSFEAERRDGRGLAVANARVVLPGPSEVELVLREPVEVSVTGSVRDERGNAVPGARVEAWRRARDVGALERHAAEAGDGLFVLDGLEEGSWTLQATGEGWTSSPRSLLVDALTRPQDFVLVAATEVSGVVLDAEGQPVEGAQLFAGRGSVSSSGSGVGGRQRSDARGQFRLPVPPGKLVLTAAAEGHASSLPLELELERGELRSDLVLRLRPACTLQVRVVAPEGKPVAGAQLGLIGLSTRAETDVNGVATLTDVPPGPFRLRIERAGFLLSEHELELVPGTPLKREFVLRRPSTGAR